MEPIPLTNEFGLAIGDTVQQYQGMLFELLRCICNPFREGLWKALPPEGGVYRICDTDDDASKTVYVGKSEDLRRRIYHDHLMGNRRASTLKNKLINSGNYQDETSVKRYLQERCWVQVLQIGGDSTRTTFEHFAVAILKPDYND